MISKTKAALLASALLVMPGTALAQNQDSEEVTEQAGAVEETAEQLQQEANTLGNVVAGDATRDGDAEGARDDRDDRGDGDGVSGKWGLLGLLGLAGLLGLKRRDDDHDHNDRRGTMGTTGTRTGTGTDSRL
jgi:hypothetical protein